MTISEPVRPGENDRTEQPPAAHAALALIAFAPLEPTEATLRRLLLTLALLSTALWLLCVFAGRRICRQALTPLTEMALAARHADAADPGSRLPLPGTRDELEDLGSAFNGLLDRLHESLQRQRRFTGDASHQLRTPLTGLLSQVDVALRMERPPREYQRVLNLVRAKAAQLRQIIESLMFLARAESECGLPELEVMDLTAWLPEHLRTWSTDARAEDIQVAPQQEGPVWVRAHPALLAQLLDNLLENACKYSPPRTPVLIETRTEPGSVTLTVVDRGYGLSVEDRARVFEPFYRSQECRSRGQTGAGLGLAVAERIVTAFGGRICVDSAPDAGSRFAIILPAAACDASSAARAPAHA